jgi:DNA-binding beta-propeller fold protein YncE
MRRRAFIAALAGAPILLRSDPDAFARLLGGGPERALVTADLDAELVVVDTQRGRVLGRVATAAGPRSIQTVGSEAVVAHTALGRLSIVGGRELAVRRVVDGFEQPRYTAGSPDGRYAYVTDSGRGEVVTVERETGRILHRARLGGPARHVSITPNGRWLWVALGSSATRLVVLDLAIRARPYARHTFATPFPVHDVALEPGGRRAWVTSGRHGNDEVLVFDAFERRVLARLRAGTPPQHVSFGASAAFVTSGDDGMLRVFSLARRPKLLRSTPVPRGSYNVQASGGTIVTPSLTEGTLCLLDDRGRVYVREHVAVSSHDACLLPAL